MLKPDRQYNIADSDPSYYMGGVAASGIVVAYPTGDVVPPGLDDNAQYAIVPTNVSNKIVGILMNEVVNPDLSNTELQSHLNKVPINHKVEIVRRGWFVTDQLEAGIDPVVGGNLYFKVGGQLTTTASSAVIGRFESVVTNGFARVFINIA